MKERVMKALVRAGEKLGLEVREYDDYSGRGMYGKTTCAVVVEDVACLAACAAKAVFDYLHAGYDENDGSVLAEDVIDEMKHLKTDSLGHDLIVY